MRPKVSVFIATSLDGFIARKNGEIDWLNAVSASAPEGEDYGYGAFFKTIDTLVMGRNTYEQVLTFGEWPYGSTPVVVLSRNLIDFPARVPETVSYASQEPLALCERLARAGANHLYIDGGVTIQRFLKARLIDEMIITLIPIILGEGIPLFGPIPADIQLTLVGSTAYESGLVQLKYSVTNSIT